MEVRSPWERIQRESAEDITSKENIAHDQMEHKGLQGFEPNVNTLACRWGGQRH